MQFVSMHAGPELRLAYSICAPPVTSRMLCRALLQQDTCHSGWLLAMGYNDSQLWPVLVCLPGDVLLGHERHR